MAPTTRSSKRALTVPEDSKPKRQRLAAKVQKQPTPLTSLVQHSELWFADGNIVLATEHTCFKVHRSQLARFCIVFEDMFSQPSGGPDQEIMEGCVVVRMPDGDEDLTNFLQAMYNGWSFNFDIYPAANFSAVSGALRLATKYDCAVLRNVIVRNFRQHFPSNRAPLYFFGNQPYRVAIINLARECDILDILLPCFYQLAFGDFVSLEPIKLLVPADRKRLKEGKKAVLRRVAAILSKGKPDVPQACLYAAPRRGRDKRTSPKRPCAIFLDTYWANRVELGENMQGVVAKDPLRQLAWLSEPPGPPRGSKDADNVCSSCRRVFRDHMDGVIATLRSNLHVDFML